MSQAGHLRTLCEYISGMQYSQRRFGKTTAAVELVRKVDGVLLCATADEAARVSREHGVRAVSIQLYDPRGRQDPIVVDQDAFAREMLGLLRHLEDVCRRYGELEDRIYQAQAILGGAKP